MIKITVKIALVVRKSKKTYIISIKIVQRAICPCSCKKINSWSKKGMNFDQINCEIYLKGKLASGLKFLLNFHLFNQRNAGKTNLKIDIRH